MAKQKTTTEEPLEKQLWKAADKLRKIKYFTAHAMTFSINALNLTLLSKTFCQNEQRNI
ncbi:MAG: hypothetical protein LCH67_00710 [Bacteroidetes bacterium]|nr:hypothetical protein [Bacteroidota bacterium]